MEPNKQNSAESPRPANLSPERLPDTQSQPETITPSLETIRPSGDSASQGHIPIALPPPVIDSDVSGGQLSQADPTAQIGPAVAADVDVIEKEWVNKAKAIVHEHKHDPYTQENEASRLKADYKTKRFNKVVKTDA
ncbi:MAG TPA: hypothetical protein VGA08_01105 [Candidatus Saccharimonadales bacterium]